MKPENFRPRHWAGSLRTRLIAFLTIALLPLGAIAVLQTVQVMREAERLADRDLLTRTTRAASEQDGVLRRAFGAAEALGYAATELLPNSEACSRVMSDFIDRQPTFVFAGFIAADGMMTCNSAGAVINYEGTPQWEAFAADPRRLITSDLNGDASRQSVFIIFSPILSETGTLLGGQALSIPHDLARTLLASEVEDLELALLSPEGEILSASTGMDDVRRFQRLGIVPQNLDIPASGLVIDTQTRINDLRQSASLVPLVRDRVYVLGLWAPTEGISAVTFWGRAIPLFPILMWIASLVVAYFTINNLVLRHLAHLRQRMETYRSESSLSGFALTDDAPPELVEIADSYNELVLRVANDQATLEDTIREKDVLLREVHHRVKNNLQLIASILNMQMRGIADPGAKQVLKRVQDRVMSLSSIHRALYTYARINAVRADELLASIIDGLSDIALPGHRHVAVRRDLAPVLLDPDQAVPLSLMATEAITNAAKYVGTPSSGTPEIEMSLSQPDEDTVVFRARNTRGPETLGAVEAGESDDGSGLGARLIKAFASQLGGELEIDISDDAYDVSVRFTKCRNS